MTYLKFCGLTRAADVEAAAGAGADAIGFVLWPSSPRFVPVASVAGLVRRVPATVTPVGVLVAPSRDEVARALDAGVRVAQVHGWTPETLGAYLEALSTGGELWLAASAGTDVSMVPDAVTLLMDAHDPDRHGGTGRTADWDAAAALARERRVLLAGGLTPRNVADAIRRVRPWGVDVASGVEERPGVKKTDAMRQFAAAVREADR